MRKLMHGLYKRNTREQAYLFTDCLDNIIDSDNEVRILDVFVVSINIKEFGIASELIYKDLPESRQNLRSIVSFIKK